MSNCFCTKSILYCVSFCLIFLWQWNSSCFAQLNDLNPEACISRYEAYLKSLKCFKFSYRNISPSGYEGESKYNGLYYYSSFKNSSSGQLREVISSQHDYQTLENNNEDDLFLYGYLDSANNEAYSFTKGFRLKELFGYFTVYPELPIDFIPELLRSMELTAVYEKKEGTDLVLLSGQKEKYDIKCWFDPEQNYLLRALEVQNSNALKTGETIRLAVTFDKFIDVRKVRFPTFYRYEYSQVNEHDTEVLDNEITIALDNIDIWTESKPRPFTFQTKIPNGTKAVLFDAPQIEYIWMDGEIVPKTDERMLAIARQERHTFIPGPKEPRFWLMAIGILLILVAGGFQVRRYLKSR